MDYYSGYTKKLEAICSRKGASLIEIGRVNDMPMYRVILNSFGEKRIVYSAGIHGIWGCSANP